MSNTGIVIAFEHRHLFQNRFRKEMAKRFKTRTIMPLSFISDHSLDLEQVNNSINELREEVDKVVLITDTFNQPTSADQLITMGINYLVLGDPIEFIKVPYTFFLTKRIFYEICSWIMEMLCPEKYYLL